MKSLFVFWLTWCGLTFSYHTFENRMLGGTPTQEEVVKSIASIKHFANRRLIRSCVGVVIDDYWILTSASCAFPTTGCDIVVDLGQTIFSVNSSDHRHLVDEICIHNYFDMTTGENDIALLHLSKPVDFTDSIQKTEICRDPKGDQLVVIAFNEDVEGGLGRGKPEKNRLGRIEVKSIPIETCREKYKELDEKVGLNEKQICVDEGKGKDLCVMDSGAPLFCANMGGLAGIFTDVIYLATEHTHQCHPEHEHPLLFTKIEMFEEWIKHCIEF